MAFSIWDWWILGATAAVFVTVVLLVVALLRLKNGPINGIINRGRATASVIWRLLGALYRATYGNDDQITRVSSAVRGIADGLGSAVKTPAGATINYRTLAATWGALRTGRGLFRQALGLVNRPKRGATRNVSATGPVVTPRRSLADRLGLVPPAARHVSRVAPFARGAFAAYRELRRRGIL
jgi:hypothetical protein